MNYYQFHIGDFRSGTIHMSRKMRWIYRDMLDVYYDTERPLSLDFERLCSEIGATEELERSIVQKVLRFKFTETESGYCHAVCDRVIAEYRGFKHWASDLPQSARTSIQAERNATKARATPTWLTKEDRLAIADIYALAALKTAETGIKHEVDHIVPLRSKLVCGLHVSWNLSVITASKNRAKTNSFQVS